MNEATRNRVTRCVTAAIEETNALADPADALGTDEASPFLEGDGTLDSLGLVNFAVFLESRVESEFGSGHGLVAALLEVSDPARLGTVGHLVDFVVAQVGDEEA